MGCIIAVNAYLSRYVLDMGTARHDYVENEEQARGCMDGRTDRVDLEGELCATALILYI